jgi:leader peptidase (prepilin peptidase)/N-methyltransferase
VAFFTQLSLPLRIAIIFVFAVAISRFINWAIYTWAYFPRRLGPWSPPAAAKEIKRTTKGGRRRVRTKEVMRHDRSWLDHLPVLGWLRLRDEWPQHGRLYWLRPLMIELLYPLGIAWYYNFYISGGALPPGSGRFLIPILAEMHWQFLGHWFLFTFLTIATFIDFDERTIPDLVTIPATVVGLVGAALSPLWLPLTLEFGPSGIVGVTDLYAAWPDPWPLELNGPRGLLIGIFILAVWGFALLDRRVILRRGWRRAWIYFWARVFRHRRMWLPVGLITLGLMGFTALIWARGGEGWKMMISSLLGLAFAGGITWAVRLSASYGFGAEALGFGDVTLMAMIGTFVGWQPSLIVFFLAPFLALGFVLVRWALTGDMATPYGPYLSTAVVVLLIYWDSLWTNWAAPVFALGASPILLGLIVCVAMIGIMLWAWQLIKRAVWQ